MNNMIPVKAHQFATPSTERSPILAQARRVWLTTSFPWLVFAACWLIFFVMDNKMDAPLTSLDERVVSDVAQQVSDGDVVHKVLTVLLGAVGAVLCFQNRKRIQVHGVMAVVFITYVGWICFGALTAEDPDLTIRRIGGFLISMILCAGCSARMDVDSNSFFIAGVPTLTLIPDIIAELRCHGLEALTPGGRFGGTYPHPNVAAAALALPVLVFTWFAFRAKGVYRILFACLSVLVITFFLLTRSRTALLAVVGALLFSVAIVLLRDQKQYLSRLLAVGLLVIGMAGLTGLVANFAPAGFSVLSILHSDRDEGDPTTLTGRVDLWKTCLEYAQERPLLGFGFGGFWSAKHIESISAEQKWPINQSHSAYIDQLLALGFPGALLHILTIVVPLFICTARFFRGEDQFGVWAALLVFVSIHSFTEAISLAPGFLNFVLSLVALQLSVIRPGTLQASPVERRTGGNLGNFQGWQQA